MTSSGKTPVAPANSITPRKPAQNEHRPELLPARYGGRRRVGRATSAGLPGQRENHHNHPNPVPRIERADCAFFYINSNFNAKQQAFLEFVLSHYINVGVEKLDQQKLAPLLRLRYGAMHDAIADLGRPEEIGRSFTGFQKYLYTAKSA